ncbi:MAG TPA: hypothetical protein VNM24_04955, partial [Burkholderiales bacterium]|nr:hypothetical protein [Burkholderiales bacterium]
IAQYLFDPQNIYGNRNTWSIAHYHGSDAPPDPAGVADASGFAATLFERSTEEGSEKALSSPMNALT